MKVLVVGSNGLIGSAVCTHLRTQGHEVSPYDITDTPIKASLHGDYDAAIDCARYEKQPDQILTWDCAISRMRNKGNGRLILFSSIYGHVAPDFSIYPGTDIQATPLEYAIWKGGTEQAVRYLAQRLKPWGIQANAIAPGGVCDKHSEEFQQAYRESGGAGMIRTANILPVVDMLLHPDNAVNGQIITVDGGWSL